MKNPKRRFKKDLIKIFIDRLLIGLFLLVAMFCGNRIAENLKTADRVRIESANEIANKAGEVWRLVYLYDQEVSKLYSLYQIHSIPSFLLLDNEKVAKIKEEIVKIEKKADDIKDMSENKAIENRYYIGEKNYEQVMKCSDTITQIWENKKIQYYNIDTPFKASLVDIFQLKDDLKQQLKISADYLRHQAIYNDTI